MSKRAGLAPIQRPKPIPTAQILDSSLSSSTCHSIVSEMLSDIISRGVDLLHQHEMERQAQQTTAEQAVHLTVQAVEWLQLGHDMGECLASRGIVSPESPKSNTKSGTATSLTAKLAKLLMEETESHVQKQHTKPAANTMAPLVKHDGGSLWVAEPEPPPCDLDRWARGAIPVVAWTPSRFHAFVAARGGHANTISGASTPTPGVLSPINRRPSSTGSSTHRSRNSWDKAADKRAGSADATTNKKGRLSLGVPSRVLEDDDDEETKAAKAAAALIPRPLDNKATSAQIEHEKWRIQEMKKLERKQKQRAKQEQIKANSVLELERYEKLSQELRGRNYTVDPITGNIIFIQPLKPDKMPHISHVPHMTVRDGDVSAEEEAMALQTRAGRIRARSRDTTRTNGATSLSTTVNTSVKFEETKTEETTPPDTKVERVRHSRASLGLKTKKPKPTPRPVDQFIDTAAVQPPIVQTIQLAPGVTIRQGAHAKSGISSLDKLKSSSVAASSAVEYGLTRSQYLTLIHQRKQATHDVTMSGSRAATAWQAQRVKAGTLPEQTQPQLQQPIRPEWEHHDNHELSLEHQHHGQDMEMEMDMGMDMSTPDPSSQLAPSDASGLGSVSVSVLSHDWSAGSFHETGPFPVHVRDTDTVTGTRTGTGTGTRAAGDFHPIIDRAADFNAAILADTAWGTQHGDPHRAQHKKHYTPNKPSPSDRLLTVGRRARLPRERPFVEKPTSTQRQHLPPPAYPHVTGHGQIQTINNNNTNSQRCSPSPFPSPSPSFSPFGLPSGSSASSVALPHAHAHAHVSAGSSPTSSMRACHAGTGTETTSASAPAQTSTPNPLPVAVES